MPDRETSDPFVCDERTTTIPTEIETNWQRLVDLMAEVMGVQTALIIKYHPTEVEVMIASKSGDNPFSVGERHALDANLYCTEVISRRERLLVPDARQDLRWIKNPALERGLVAYLGYPLLWPDGTVFGTICVFDGQPNPFSTAFQKLVAQFKLVVEADLALLCEINERERIEALLQLQTRELETNNEDLEAFAHTVAHDLKTPLAVMQGYTSLMQSDPHLTLDNSSGQYLAEIDKSIQKMANIIDGLLLLASVRQAAAMVVEPLNMEEIVAAAMERLDHLVRETGAEIVRPDSWLPALGYAPWVEGVWVNYLSNAIKYGGHPPRVELGSLPEGDNSVSFWVRDNGTGLTPEQREALFTPFTRLEQVRTKGYGLGLSIVRRIVEKLGGQVGIDGRELQGQGSLFFFTLPRVPG